MAEAQQDCVRETAGPFAERPRRGEYFRDVDAPLIRHKAISGDNVTVEWLERSGRGSVGWRYRQERDALFYFDRGVHSCRGLLNGDHVECQLNGGSKLAFIQAGSTVESEVDVPGKCSYWVAHFDHTRLLGDDPAMLAAMRPGSRLGLDHAAFAGMMVHLESEFARGDPLTRLFLESWTVQALVLLYRLSGDPDRVPCDKLDRRNLNSVIEFMRTNLDQDISLSAIAGMTGLSIRQFRRRFHAATGVGPNEMLTKLRLNEAARKLRYSRRSITDIALDCGFSQPQHLATAFRRRFGLTPSEFRRRAIL